MYEAWGPDTGWAIGAGFYGAGMVVDLAGSDVYRGENRVEGVGGPRGLGALLDVAGNDLYVAYGPDFPSAYGTPAVACGLSQGFGVGIRGYAAGGVGAIYDLAGNDRYEAGEFSQAGGYFFGLGILHDAAGNDLFHGNRYGQSFAAHQAAGILVDEAGDDTYWSMTAASQAGTWDQSIGLLVDRAGNDAYRCDGLGQGGASMQAVAVLVDLAGNDRYSGAGTSVQGGGGGNSYHHDADRVFSFSALLDLGGGADTYSSGRGRRTLRTGAYRPDLPGTPTSTGCSWTADRPPGRSPGRGRAQRSRRTSASRRRVCGSAGSSRRARVSASRASAFSPRGRGRGRAPARPPRGRGRSPWRRRRPRRPRRSAPPGGARSPGSGGPWGFRPDRDRAAQQALGRSRSPSSTARAPRFDHGRE